MTCGKVGGVKRERESHTLTGERGGVGRKGDGGGREKEKVNGGRETM